jgi:DNA-binding protein HU-beta
LTFLENSLGYISQRAQKAIYLQSKKLGNCSNNLFFNKKMTKADIVNEITKNTGIDKVTVLATIEAFMDTVKASLSEDENVYLRGFGSFVVKKRAQKTARNISKNTTIIIPEHNIPAFKPAKTFTISVKK